MEFNAFKMDGLGNDFIIIDKREINISLSNDQIIKICGREFLGCDQLIFIKKDSNLDAELEFYNSDGSKSEACGNGTRCVAYLLSNENNKKEINLSVNSKILKSKILDKFLITTLIYHLDPKRHFRLKDMQIQVLLSHYGSSSQTLHNCWPIMRY